ncbi:integrase [Marinobacter sp. EVN1]|uniref:Integrase-like protein n=1 Tax=Marinobacter nauticus TaxID=2743 RepID=A0A368V546_MARNT|nr:MULTISPECIES: site-specific integrase [Marinobacter]MAH31872.1 integrase [Marinobacter sp.]MEC8823608.1 site-specific integrase [Pseudomonadota bacterium]ERS85417.1 integrase [Marinobacter sp. EVN1]MAP31507.1 integrase [Marinobacter sp.]MED5466468.1 site-specific integrase [Pseudomonadota bacterium]|tara:strand:+ start:54 stop:368 length:315 start_codon:yes stop_codon:yes gene_type:complete
MDITEALEQSRPGMIGQVQAAIRKRELNQRAEQTYLHWISRFVLFHDLKDPDNLAEEDQKLFLTYLSEKIRVSRARLNQASQALSFFYEDVLGRPTAAADSAAA